MPIDYYIDHEQRLVVARGCGVFSHADVVAYQGEVWTQPVLRGYDELVDMTDVETIHTPSPAGPRLQELAAEAASHDDPAATSKFAIVAPSILAYGLGRQFQAYRECQPRSTKQVGVFRTLAEALAYLGNKKLVEGAEYRRSAC